MPLIDIHHVTIKTQNLEATNEFYAGVLGMTFADRPDLGFPGTWFNLGRTMLHIVAGNAAVDADGKAAPEGGASVDHVAIAARDFDAMKQRLIDHDLEWRQSSIPEAKIWQLFVHDPSGVLIELNFDTANETLGAKGPGDDNKYVAGKFQHRSSL